MIKNITLLSVVLLCLIFSTNTYAQPDGVRYSSFHQSSSSKSQGKIYKVTEIAPKPVDGLVDFYENTKLHIKKALIKSGQKADGVVFVRFIVEKDGTLSDVHVVKGVGGCDSEVVECFKQAKWKPGIQAGKAVRVQKTISIRLD